MIKNRRKLLIVGLTQSGSVLLFNLLKLILEENGEKVSTNKLNNSSNIIIENHTNYETIKNTYNSKYFDFYVFLPLRDIRDCAVFEQNIFKNIFINKNPKIKTDIWKVIKWCDTNINLFNSWIKKSNYIFKYEEYIQNPLYKIKQLSKQLKVNLSDKQIENVFNKLFIEKVVVEKAKLYETHFTNAENKVLSNKLSKWLSLWYSF